MPCNDARTGEDNRALAEERAVFQFTARALCEASALLESHGLMPKDSDLARWWVAHKKADSKRAAQEQEFAKFRAQQAQETERKERAALAALKLKYGG